MLPVFLLLLLSATVEAAGRQPVDACVPTCSQLLSRLSEVRRWCSTTLRLPVPETVLGCGPPDGFAGAPPPRARDSMLVATSPGYEALWGRDTRWTVCHANRISYRIVSDAYFGAVWDASGNPCRQNYSVWLATHNAPPCWQNNASDSLRERTVNQKTALSLSQNRTYQCRHCNFSSDAVSEIKPTLEQTYTYVITNVGAPTVFRYLSCNETSGYPYPTLSVVSSILFTCRGCRWWIYFAEENSFEYGECKTETETQTTVEPIDGFHRICKKVWVPDTLPPTEETTTRGVWVPTTLPPTGETTTKRVWVPTTLPPTEETTTKRVWVPTTLPPTEGTTTSLLDNQTTNTEANNIIPDKVQEALKQLEPKTLPDEFLKNRSILLNPDQMLTNLENVLNFSYSLKQDQVSQSLEGFELFSKAILLENITSDGNEVVVRHDHSTLVIASGIVGALVSTDGDSVDLLRYGQEEYSVEWMLARPAAVGVVLPEERGVSAAALAVTVLRRDLINGSFLHQGLHVNSDVISVQVATWNSSSSTNYVDVFLEPRVRGVRRRCGVWNLTSNAWDFSNCTMYHRGQVVDACRCWHLTHFAQLVTDADLQWGGHAWPLEVLSLAGAFASLLGTIGLTAAAVLERSWRRKPGTRALLQLGSAVAARDVLLALVTVDAFRPSWLWHPEDPTACRLLGVALHYALLGSVAWTTAAAVLQLLRLSTLAGAQAVFPHVVLVSSACSWLSPLVPVAALLATKGLEAGYPLRQDSATEFLCYPQGVALYTTVVLPVALCTAVNTAIFLYLLLTVLFPVCQDEFDLGIRSRSAVQLRRRVLTAVVLFFVLGLPWLLGPPARVPVLAYLFCLVATPQGMVLFVFFVVCNGRLRKSICSTMSRAVFSTTTVTTSSTTAGYSRSPHATLNTRTNNSASDTTLVRNRRNVRLEEDLELPHRTTANPR